MLAIIGGTGLTQLDSLEIKRREIVRTDYGTASAPLVFGKLAGKEVIFLARHGSGHTIPPHKVNYRANIDALKQVDVTHIAAIATVGGISQSMNTGTIAVPDQIIDYTHGRDNTFFDGSNQSVNHIDFTKPYTEALRQQWLQAAQQVKEAVVDGGTYATTQGPRLETAAEIIRLERDGATMVGMTGMPEAALARELEIEYAAICPVANYAAGKGDSQEAIDPDALVASAGQTMHKVNKILTAFVSIHHNAS